MFSKQQINALVSTLTASRCSYHRTCGYACQDGSIHCRRLKYTDAGPLVATLIWIEDTLAADESEDARSCDAQLDAALDEAHAALAGELEVAEAALDLALERLNVIQNRGWVNARRSKSDHG